MTRDTNPYDPLNIQNAIRGLTAFINTFDSAIKRTKPDLAAEAKTNPELAIR